MHAMTAEQIRQYSTLVAFLGNMLGPDYEIALHDLGRRQASIVAIANGHISGREVGAPLTNLAMQMINEKTYLTQDWKLNYRGVSASGKVLRCSTMFIRDEHGALAGLLCISFDDSRYRELSEQVFRLCHPDEYAQKNIAVTAAPLAPASQEDEQEAFYTSISAAAEDAFLAVMKDDQVPTDRLTQDEKLQIIRLLEQRGIFMLKGAIPIVAERLSCSQASIYRYLSKIGGGRHRPAGQA